MADFRTHIGASTVVGIAYGVWGHLQGAPLSTSVLAGGLCSVAGMLPDLDSDTGRPAREMITLIAAVVPALMLDRFKEWGLTNEWIAVATMGVYLFIRFGIGELFKNYTVHRGMWHSVPACAIAGMITFLLCPRQAVMIRFYYTVAVMLGFTVHLLLDEIWSISLSTTKFGLKSSWGTALKFWSGSGWATFVTYAKLALLLLAVAGDPQLMHHFGYDAGYNTREVRRDTRQYLREQFNNAKNYFETNPADEVVR